MRLYLVRHGRARASFGEALDPPLDPVGVGQAEAMARRLGPVGPLALVASPMQRTRETAAPLERLWSRTARIERMVSEIPTPALALDRRQEWLRGVMAGHWSGLDADLGRWRAAVLQALLAMREPTVVISHFIAINVAVGAALGDDRVVVFSPDHCAITVVEIDGGALRLVERGAEAATGLL
jgi:broad specificity phosphatase PhoE